MNKSDIKKARPVVLFVSMPGVIHTGRWMDQLVDEGWDLHLFSPTATSDLTVHETVPKSATLHLVVKQKRAAVRQTGIYYPFERGDRVRLGVTRLHEKIRPRSVRLANLIEEIRPDIIHTMEISKAGYLALDAKRVIESRGAKFPKWIYSSWGNDLYMYGPMPEHGARIRSVLSEIDYMFIDCERDNQLARDYGFDGPILGVYPTGGGFPVREMQHGVDVEMQARKTVALKGIIREDNQGRALTALEALDRCADVLEGYEIAIYSADRSVIEKAAQINGRLRINVLPPLSHTEFIALMGRTRLSIGLNISDGTPNTMLESMMMGAFPIQSDTVSTREWIEHGVNGLLVSPEDPEDLARAVRSVINDESVLKRAAVSNMALIRQRLERAQVRRDVVGAYKSVLNSGVESTI